MADTFDGGWDTARQYDAYPFGSDSEDESKVIGAKTGPLGRKRQRANQQLNNNKFLPPLVIASIFNSTCKRSQPSRFPGCPGPVRWKLSMGLQTLES